MDPQEQQRRRQRDLDMAAAAYELVHDAIVSPRERIQAAIAALPTLGKHALEGVDLEEPCPICLVPLSTVLAEDEAWEEVGKDTDEAHLAGVTKLVECGHIFCRRDLTEWIRSQHGSCPTCRHTFLNIRPPSESDDESSDGGEYIPNPDDFEDEDEDAFLDVDGFTDTDADDFPVESMDLDFDRFWEDGDAHALGVELASDAGADETHPYAPGDSEMGDAEDEFEEGGDEDIDIAEEWGLTDGESESMSSSDAGDMSMEEAMHRAAGEVPDREVSVSAHEDEDPTFDEDAGLSVNTDGALALAQEEKRNGE